MTERARFMCIPSRLPTALPSGSLTGQLPVTYDETFNSPNLGYPTAVTDANGDRVNFDAFDPLGDLLQVSTYPVTGNTQIKNTTIFGYDALQRPTFALYPEQPRIPVVLPGPESRPRTDEAGTQYNFEYGSLPAVDRVSRSGGQEQ